MSIPSKRLQILVVDDSPVYRKLVEQVLSSEEFTLLFARDGHEAMTLYKKHSPDIVLTDWILPDFSGLELCRRMRSDASHPSLYVIIMTSKAHKENVVAGLDAGANDYLTKPFDPAEMLARIRVGRRVVELTQELAARNRELEEVAQTDHLTGLPNRRALEQWASKQLRGAARHGFYVWVCLCDIDFFKTINDTYGHDAGDVVLRAFADILKNDIRGSDICGRLGGDEFLLVITHVNAAQIEVVVNRLREKFASSPFTFSGQKVRVSATFGVAGFRHDTVNELKQLLELADQMLYEAKRKGRNCIEVSNLDEPESGTVG